MINDNRIEQILQQIVRFAGSDFGIPLPISDNGDELDAIIVGLNTLGEELQSKREFIKENEKRIAEIMEALIKGTRFDFSQRLEISEHGDEIDAISVGINTMNEELEWHIRETQENQERIDTIFRNAPDAVIVIDTEGKITEWNPKAEKIFGWKKEEVTKKFLHEIIIPERFREDHKRGMQRFLKTGEGPVLNKAIDLPALKKDNTEFQVELSISPVTIKGRYFFIGFLKDITERKKAEEKLKESEEKFNKVFQISPAGIVIANAATTQYVDINDSFLKIIGYERNEVIGHSSQELNLIDPSDRLKILDELGKTGLAQNIEVVFNKKSGEKGHALFSTQSIIINGEKCYLTILYDISGRKKAELELNQKSLDLTRSNQELEQFAYVASHDLQEPLRMVSSYLQLLEKRYKDKLDADANDFIQFAVDGSNRMRNLINSLLQYSRVNRIKPFEKINTKGLLQEVLQDLKDVIKVNAANVKVEELPDVFGDTVLIGQLFQNLISNAIKFKGEKNPEVIISGREQNGELLFSVKDNGIGIQKEYSDKIFVIFQRLHSKEKYPGTGIGLAICKKIAERHGGKIWVESEVGKGSTFYFTLIKH